MSGWTGLESRNLGSRTNYADALEVLRAKGRKRRTRVCAFAADGIGDSMEAARAARAAIALLVGGVRAYLTGRRSGRRLDAKALERKVVQQFRTGSASASAAGSTLVGATTDGDRVCVLWAGDSRAYVLDDTGQLLLLTADDVDADDQIVRYFSDGAIVGGLRSELWRGSVGALFVCTDGVSRNCQAPELAAFVCWCVRNGLRDSRRFSSALAEFLGPDVPDNFSAALWYRRSARRQLRRIRAA